MTNSFFLGFTGLSFSWSIFLWLWLFPRHGFLQGVYDSAEEEGAEDILEGREGIADVDEDVEEAKEQEEDDGAQIENVVHHFEVAEVP